MDSNGIHLIRIHIMTHPPLTRMHQLIGLNDGDFKVTCDAIIFDLEDAVAPDTKEAAREQVLAQLAAGGYGARKLVVRANSIDSPWGEDDLIALAQSPVSTICLPKIDSVDQVLPAWGQTDKPVGRSHW